jgi:hypothetical protein
VTTITVNPKQIAVFIATKLREIAYPALGIRNDVGPVQIDFVNVSEGIKDIPAVQFKFELQENMGVTIVVKLSEFAADPIGYMRDLLTNLNGIRHSAMERRNGVHQQASSLIKAFGSK